MPHRVAHRAEPPEATEDPLVVGKAGNFRRLMPRPFPRPTDKCGRRCRDTLDWVAAAYFVDKNTGEGNSGGHAVSDAAQQNKNLTDAQSGIAAGSFIPLRFPGPWCNTTHVMHWMLHATG